MNIVNIFQVIAERRKRVAETKERVSLAKKNLDESPEGVAYYAVVEILGGLLEELSHYEDCARQEIIKIYLETGNKKPIEGAGISHLPERLVLWASPEHKPHTQIVTLSTDLYRFTTRSTASFLSHKTSSPFYN